MCVIRGSRRRAIAFSLLPLIGIVLIIMAFRSAPVPSVILLPMNKGVKPTRRAFDTWVPISWAWYWRTKEFMLGRPKVVEIDAAFFNGDRPLLPTPELLAFLPAPVKTVTNLEMYFVHTNETTRIYKQLTRGRSYSLSCRISTGGGIPARILSGSGSSGGGSVSLEVMAKRRGDCTDLTTSIEGVGFGDSGTTGLTNLAMAARFQIPKEHAVLILKSAERPEQGETFGVILRAKWK